MTLSNPNLAISPGLSSVHCSQIKCLPSYCFTKGIQRQRELWEIKQTERPASPQRALGTSLYVSIVFLSSGAYI